MKNKHLKTIKGVYKDIRNSDFIATNGKFTYFFSSEASLLRFIKLTNEDKQGKASRTENTFKMIQTSFELFLDLEYYLRCEKRGFYAFFMGKEVSKEELLNLAHRTILTDYYVTGEFRRVEDNEDLIKTLRGDYING